MDPSIMKKLLEEDEDETIHSGAEIDAFTAALNRDIQRDSSSFHNSDSDTAAFVQGSNQTSTQFPQWQTLNLDENARCQSQQGASVSQRQDINQHICGSENQQHQLDSLQESKQKDVHIPQSRSMNDFKINPNPNPDPRVQKMSSTTSTHQQTINIMNPNKQVPFALLVPVIEPQLDKDKAIQLQNVYNKLKQNEISKDVFLRHIRSIVGDQLLKMAVYKLHGHEAARISQSGPNNCTSQHMQSTSSPCGTGSIVKTPPKRPSSIGQKKPLETLVSSPPLPGKKQKVSGAFSDQSIDQLNDVTAVSGVNLMEEEEQLFSGPKEYSEVSEASRRVVQEEEERLFLQKIPLHKKLAEIMIRSGLKGVSPDVERCLSLCAEERMRGLLCNLVKLSKQRVDIEKPRHRTVITSDVGQQILMMNRKIREEWEQKQADVEKLQKINDPEGAPGVDGDKDDGRGKSVKMQQANKEEDDKMRTNAANVAARAAFGGDDMFSKWQLMAEQAHQKREGVPEAPSLMQLPKEAGRKPASTMAKNSKDDNNHKAESRSLTVAMAAGARKSGKSQFAVLQSKVARSISAKDVIAVLEREPQTLKTRLIYRVYEKMRSGVVAE